MMLRCSEINIDKIYLMMGNACNFRCRYCLQDCMKFQQQHHEPTERVYQYINHLIKIRPRYLNKISMIFFGGEPMIYFNTIKKVIERFDNSLDYVIITNGSMIDSKSVGYFNKHKIGVVISNDGINTVCTRGRNVLDEPKLVKNIKKIKHLIVESVTSQYNYDYASLFNYIESKLGNNVDIIVDKLQVTWDMPSDIYNIPIDDYNTKLRWIAGQALADMINYRDTNAVRLFYTHVQNILKNKEVNLPICGAFYNSLNIDCGGNIYVCHNSSEQIGTIDDERIILKDRYDKWLSKHLDDKCNDCSFFNLCGGSCPLEHEYRHKICNVYKVFFAVCIDLANAYINSLEPVDWSVAE